MVMGKMMLAVVVVAVDGSYPFVEDSWILRDLDLLKVWVVCIMKTGIEF